MSRAQNLIARDAVPIWTDHEWTVCARANTFIVIKLLNHFKLVLGRTSPTPFHHNSNLIKTKTKKNILPESIAVVACANIWSDLFITIWIRAEGNFHWYWSLIEKLFVKWTTSIYSTYVSMNVFAYSKQLDLLQKPSTVNAKPLLIRQTIYCGACL